MRWSITLFLVISFLQGQSISPFPYLISGKLASSRSPLTAYLYILPSADQPAILQESEIVNNTFIFQGSVNQKENTYSVARIFFHPGPGFTVNQFLSTVQAGKKEYYELLLDRQLSFFVAESGKPPQIEGSKLNNEFRQLLQIKADYKSGSVPKPVDQQTVLEKPTKQQVLANKILLAQIANDNLFRYYGRIMAFILEHAKSPLMPGQFELLVSMPETLKPKFLTDFEQLFSVVDSSLLVNPKVRVISRQINQQKIQQRFDAGDILPDYTFNDAEDSVSIGHYRGKYFLLYFWTSWSTSSLRFQAELEAAFLQYPSRGFDILQVSMDADINSWKKAFMNRKVLWKQARLKKGWDSKVQAAFEINGLPTTFLLNPEGRIIGKNLTVNQLIEVIRKIPS